MTLYSVPAASGHVVAAFEKSKTSNRKYGISVWQKQSISCRKGKKVGSTCTPSNWLKSRLLYSIKASIPSSCRLLLCYKAAKFASLPPRRLFVIDADILVFALLPAFAPHHRIPYSYQNSLPILTIITAIVLILPERYPSFCKKGIETSIILL